MIDAAEFLRRVRVDADLLDAWVEAGWLRPQRGHSGWSFSEADLARAHLICDLQVEFDVNDEGIAIALDLLDQVHNLRRTLRGVLTAVRAQPETLQRRIVADFRLRALPEAPEAGRSHRRAASP
jgi:chaperone modulatory protein CbpM